MNCLVCGRLAGLLGFGLVSFRFRLLIAIAGGLLLTREFAFVVFCLWFCLLVGFGVLAYLF